MAKCLTCGREIPFSDLFKQPWFLRRGAQVYYSCPNCGYTRPTPRSNSLLTLMQILLVFISVILIFSAIQSAPYYFKIGSGMPAVLVIVILGTALVGCSEAIWWRYFADFQKASDDRAKNLKMVQKIGQLFVYLIAFGWPLLYLAIVLQDIFSKGGYQHLTIGTIIAYVLGGLLSYGAVLIPCFWVKDL